jgi:hypothetical protein
MILKALRKQTAVEALKFNPNDYKSLADFAKEYIVITNGTPFLMTSSGRKKIEAGDYVVKEPGKKSGEFYVLTPQAFETMFEVIKEKKKSDKDSDFDKSSSNDNA